MSGQAAGFWKVRHAVIGLAVLGMLVMLIRSCGDDTEQATQDTASTAERPKQVIYSQRPQPQQQPRYAEIPQGYPPPQVQQPAYGYPQQQGYPQPAPGQQQPVYGYSTQQPAQPQYPAADTGNPWASPTPGYQSQQPAQWGQPQRPQVQQWGQVPAPVYTQLPSGNQYRPMDDDSAQKRQPPPAAVTIPVPVPGWSAAPYDRLGGSSFGQSNAWSGGYSGYGYTPGYPATPYGAGAWPGAGYPGGWPTTPGYPGAGWPGYW